MNFMNLFVTTCLLVDCGATAATFFFGLSCDMTDVFGGQPLLKPDFLCPWHFFVGASVIWKFI